MNVLILPNTILTFDIQVLWSVFSLQLEIPLFTPSAAGTRDLHMKVMFSLHVRELSETSRSVKSTDLSLMCTILVL